MARKSKKVVLAEQQNPAAPFLFDEQNLPLKVEVLQSVKEGRYQHTGARLLDNDVQAGKLVELLMMQWPVKRIARAMQCSPKTVRAARDHLVGEGKLAPYKERIVSKMQEIIETGLDEYLRALEDGEVAAAQIPVGVGIISDKRALLLGEPTVIGGGQAVERTDSMTPEQLNSYLETLRPVAIAPADSASIVKEGKDQ